MMHRRTHHGPRCPRCGARFGKEADVTNHMNQPWSKCASWMTDLEWISDAVKIKKINCHNLNESETNANPSFQDQEAGDDGINAEETFAAESGANQDTQYVETFSGAGDVYGTGTTFMDDFKSNKYAGHRCQNIYYPFQTRSEWELASWLLRSGLSMQSINNFLSLELVCYQLLLGHEINLH